MPGTLTIEQATQMFKDNPNGANITQAKAVLSQEMARIWREIQRKPNSYVMSKQEFSVFNCFRNEYNNPTAQQAVQRYWDNVRD
jgi:hypothetical protein